MNKKLFALLLSILATMAVSVTAYADQCPRGTIYSGGSCKPLPPVNGGSGVRG